MSGVRAHARRALGIARRECGVGRAAKRRIASQQAPGVRPSGARACRTTSARRWPGRRATYAGGGRGRSRGEGALLERRPSAGRRCGTLDDLFSFAVQVDRSRWRTKRCVRPTGRRVGACWPGCTRSPAKRAETAMLLGAATRQSCRPMPRRSRLPQLDGERASPRRGGARHRAARRARDVREPRG